VKVKAFGQNTGASSIAFGARASQSVHTTAVSQRWQVSIGDTPVGQAAGTVERPSRSVMPAMFIPFSMGVIGATVFCFAVRFVFLSKIGQASIDPTQLMDLTCSPTERRPCGSAGMETSAVHLQLTHARKN
jgi:hypothetical protein